MYMFWHRERVESLHLYYRMYFEYAHRSVSDWFRVILKPQYVILVLNWFSVVDDILKLACGYAAMRPCGQSAPKDYRCRLCQSNNSICKTAEAFSSRWLVFVFDQREFSIDKPHSRPAKSHISFFFLTFSVFWHFVCAS